MFKQTQMQRNMQNYQNPFDKKKGAIVDNNSLNNPFDGKVGSKNDTNGLDHPFRQIKRRLNSELIYESVERAKDRDIQDSSNSNANLKGEAAILKKSFEEYMSGNISLKGLEKIDDALSKADIVVNAQGTGATIVDSNGNSTNLGTNAKKGRPR